MSFVDVLLQSQKTEHPCRPVKKLKLLLVPEISSLLLT